MQAELHTWFPTTILVIEDLLVAKQNEEIKDDILKRWKDVPKGGDNWLGHMWNSNGTWDIQQDYPALADAVNEVAQEYIRLHGSQVPYGITTSWVNVGEENSFQEYHTHTGVTLSACYYVAMPPGSGKLFFENPTEPDMHPIKGITEINELNFRTVHYEPKPGTLIMFRSYMRHMVERGTNTEPRVTIAFNFDPR